MRCYQSECYHWWSWCYYNPSSLLFSSSSTYEKFTFLIDCLFQSTASSLTIIFMYYSPSLFSLPNPCSLSSLFATHTLDIPNAIITSPYLILSFLYAYATTAEKKLQTHTHDTISMQKVKENTPFIIPTCIIQLKKTSYPHSLSLFPLFSPQLSLYIYETLEKEVSN